MMEKMSISETFTKQNQRQNRTEKDLGEIVCCGNHVFRVINGERHWISRPPNGYEGKIWHK